MAAAMRSGKPAENDPASNDYLRAEREYAARAAISIGGAAAGGRLIR